MFLGKRLQEMATRIADGIDRIVEGRPGRLQEAEAYPVLGNALQRLNDGWNDLQGQIDAPLREQARLQRQLEELKSELRDVADQRENYRLQLEQARNNFV